MEDQSLTVEAAAVAASVSAKTIERAIAAGDLPATKPFLQRSQIRADDLVQWVARRELRKLRKTAQANQGRPAVALMEAVP